ncbi:MAG: hypothetical protein H6623_02150 [Bdellovibrionaceae bacterium]|nr:hypothetical protein [Pseudobdellovibrionaceae bacterium]
MIHNIEQDFKLWIVDANSKNNWFQYLNYLSGFKFSKYDTQLKQKKAFHLHISPNDFPPHFILLVDVSSTTTTKEIQKVWKNLGSPKTLVFPSNHSLFTDTISIDKTHFVLLQ